MIARTTLATLVLVSFAYAAEITGTVNNRTKDRPAAGDEVTLLKLANGMQEVARTKTDAAGRFKLQFPDDPNTPHLVRVNHQSVNYHRPAPPGTTSVEVDVFDAGENVDGITRPMDVSRYEADATTLRVTRFFAVRNDSKPPRTQFKQNNFEIAIPENATIEDAIAAGPGGMPVNSAPVPTGTKGHYAFLFPLRPGETQFQIAYTIPYNGKATLTPTLVGPTESFAVSAPVSMTITPGADSNLQRKGDENGLAVYVAQNVSPGQSLSFNVSGTGAAPQTNPNDGGQTAAPGQSNQPGGGIGTPVNTPDPLYKYRWWIIGGVAVLLVAGAAFSMKHTSQAGYSQSNDPLAALKEEMFELEKDKLAGKITEAEYTKAKTALDTVLARAMKRGQ
jgi:hypothetical protein